MNEHLFTKVRQRFDSAAIENIEQAVAELDRWRDSVSLRALAERLKKEQKERGRRTRDARRDRTSRTDGKERRG